MRFTKWKNWIGENLNVYKETPASEIGENLTRHEWQGMNYGLRQEGTTLDEDIMNDLQEGLDFLVDSTHAIVDSEDHYNIIIPGLKTKTANPDGYELRRNLHFSFKSTEKNSKGISKLIINGDTYELKKIENGVISELAKGDIGADKIYKIYYDGLRFIIDSLTLLATETERGVISGLDFRGSEAAYVLGSEYGRVFGSTLTNVEAGKTYYYKDTTKNIYIPYKALNDYSNASGISVPDTTNFRNITNSYLDDCFNKSSYADLTITNGVAQLRRVGLFVFINIFIQSAPGFYLTEGQALFTIPENFRTNGLYLSFEYPAVVRRENSQDITTRFVVRNAGVVEVYGTTNSTAKFYELKGNIQYIGKSL